MKKSKKITISVAAQRKNVTVSGGNCHFVIGIDDLQNENFKGCHNDVEDCLNLRPIKEAAVIAEQDEQVASYCKRFPIKVTIDWNSVSRGKRGYVSDVRSAGKSAKWLVCDCSGTSWGDWSPLKICESNSNVRSAVSRFSCLEINFNAPGFYNPGKSKNLLPHCYKYSSSGGKLILKTSQTTSEMGSGLILEWELCSGDAKRREEAEIERIAGNRMNKEQERRMNETQRVQQKNLDAQKRYAKDVVSYEKKCKEIQKYNDQHCGFCRGSLQASCSNTSKNCSSCYGTKKKQCSCVTFKHPGKSHSPKDFPKPPKQPKDEKMPTFSPANLNISQFTDGI